MPHAIRIHEHGSAEKLKWEEVQVGDPGPGQVRVRNTAIGLNFIDTYQRSGLYPMPLPFTLRLGRARAWSRRSAPRSRSSRSATAWRTPGPIGAYAEVLLRPADRLVKIPAGIDDKVAAAMMLKGMTDAVPDPQHLPREEGRHHPHARRGGRRGPDPVPVGEEARRHRDRHRGQRRQGRRSRRRRAASTSS